MIKLSSRIILVYRFASNQSSRLFNLDKNYYAILRVKNQATQTQIKNAYYALVKEYHPDVNQGEDFKIKELNQAYQVLSSQKTRKEYDREKSNLGQEKYKPFTYENSYSASKPKQERQFYTAYSNAQKQYYEKMRAERNRKSESSAKNQKDDYYDYYQEKQQNKQNDQAKRRKWQQQFYSSQFGNKQTKNKQQHKHMSPEQQQLQNKIKIKRNIVSSSYAFWRNYNLIFKDTTQRTGFHKDMNFPQFYNYVFSKLRIIYQKYLKRKKY